MPRRRDREQETLFPPNLIYCGDNLPVLRRQDRETIDLIYLDPPFKRQASYNVLFKELSGRKAAAQIKAFADTWTWDEGAITAFNDIVHNGPARLSRAMQAFESFLGGSEMLAYLSMMAPRLVELHRVLRPTGSLYLHCDPGAGHYLKMLLDAVFGPENFRTEIVWKRSSAHSDTKQGRRQHGRVHDLILFYSKTDRWTWNPVYTPYDREYAEASYRHVEPETGRRYGLWDITGPGGAGKGNPIYDVMGVTRYWRYSEERMAELIAAGRIVQPRPGAVPRYKRYLDEMAGVPIQDVWTDVGPVGAQAAEREGYPTQKPVALLKRIIESSSDPGDVVLDPFCGCGTTVDAAQALGRRWIGIDITTKAIDVIEARVRRVHGDAIDSTYEIRWDPISVEDAKRLADLPDKSKFEEWALRRVGAPTRERQGGDRGIDGRIYFHDEPDGPTRQVIVSVKAGAIFPAHVRDLRGVMARERAEIGVLISMREPSLQMRREANVVEPYTSVYWGETYPGLQLLTAKRLLEGESVKYPRGDRVPALWRLEQGAEAEGVPSEPRMHGAAERRDRSP